VTGSAAGAKFFIDPDSCPGDEHDSSRFATVNARKTTAVLCQAMLVVGHSDQVLVRDRFLVLVKNSNGWVWRIMFLQHISAGLQQGFPQREKTLLKKILT
jgi:hypothetical protein